MKTLISAVIAAFVMASAPAFAASHAGGKMDSVDCTKAENKDKKECVKK